MIQLLNKKLIGWSNYHRYYCSKRTFGQISHQLFYPLWRWARQRHPNKGALWVRQKYFRTKGHRHWVFSTKISNKQQTKTDYLDLVDISHVPIRRHVKILAEATPFDPAYEKYFRIRQARRKEGKLFFSCRSQRSPWKEITPVKY